MSQLFARPVLKGKSITLGLLVTNAGAGTDPAFAAGDVKIQRVSDGAPVNIAALPTKYAGAAAGAHRLTLAVTETDVVGPLLVQIVKGSVDTLIAYVDVIAGPIELLDTVVEGPSQYDGAGEALPPGGVLADYDTTLAQLLRQLLAYTSGNATGLEATAGVAVIKSQVGARQRIVANLVNGNRTITSRNKT